MKNLYTNVIILPNISITYQKQGTKEKECLIVTGGRPPTVAWLKKAAQGKTVWAADHGIDVCRQANLLPERLIGDFDSLEKFSLLWAKENNVSIEQFPVEKDFTDTQLALEKAAEEGFTRIYLTGAFGNRFDHSFSTILSAAALFTSVILADEKEMIIFLKDEDMLTACFSKMPKAISLLPLFGDAKGVTITGVRWELKDAILKERKQIAISNRLTDGKNTLHASLARGTLALYACMLE